MVAHLLDRTLAIANIKEGLYMGDQVLIRLCSPTLAGLKTGSLFTVDIDDKNKFNCEVREFNRRLAIKGIRMIPVK